MTENPDILAAWRAAKRPFCVGFAAESADVARHAREKLFAKTSLDRRQPRPATFGTDDNARFWSMPRATRTARRRPRGDKLVWRGN